MLVLLGVFSEPNLNLGLACLLGTYHPPFHFLSPSLLMAKLSDLTLTGNPSKILKRFFRMLVSIFTGPSFRLVVLVSQPVVSHLLPIFALQPNLLPFLTAVGWHCLLLISKTPFDSLSKINPLNNCCFISFHFIPFFFCL